MNNMMHLHCRIRNSTLWWNHTHRSIFVKLTGHSRTGSSRPRSTCLAPRQIKRQLRFIAIFIYIFWKSVCLKHFKEQFLKVQICLAPAHFNGRLATHALHLSISSVNMTNSYWRKVTIKLAVDTWIGCKKKGRNAKNWDRSIFSYKKQ